MMRARLAPSLLLCLWALVAPVAVMAQAVRVTSGEHDGFSRIVLQFPGPVDWQLRRTDEGYALSVASQRPRYDLTDVFRLIPRDRLAAIFADPATGGLTLTVGCACHALPFELRPGLVVIDIRDGPAPQGSSFERMADGSVAPPILASTPRRPVPRPVASAETRRPVADMPQTAFDWRRDLLAASRIARPPDPPLPPEGDVSGLRAVLLQRLGRGAAEGVVDFRDMTAPAPAPFRGPSMDMERHLNVGPEPGLDAGRSVPGMLTAEGETCLTDEALDLAAWGQEGEIAASMGLVRSALLGEFDQPDAGTTSVAIRYFLHLGFGAEAQDLIRHFAPEAPDAGLWQGLADVLDGNPVAQDPFKGMEICDSAAALWAVLAGGWPLPTQGVDRAAIFRSFSALPVHLRRHLGPRLASQFREGGDVAGAATLQGAMLRAPGESGAEIRLMEAERQLAEDGTEAALPLLEPLIAGSGPTAIEATLRLITAQALEGRTVEEELITTAEAFLHEASGSARSAEIARALALGLASRARIGEALDLPNLAEDTRSTVWAIFTAKADDDRFLASTVGAGPAGVQTPDAATRQAIAARLIGSGLARPALDWLAGPMDRDFRIARAEAHRGLRDWRGVLQELVGLEDETASRLRMEAMAALNDPAVLILMQRPDIGEARRAVARRLGAWPDLLDAPAADPWAEVARLVAPAPAQDGTDLSAPPETNGVTARAVSEVAKVGPSLEATRQRVAESRTVRERIETLLTVVQSAPVP